MRGCRTTRQKQVDLLERAPEELIPRGPDVEEVQKRTVVTGEEYLRLRLAKRLPQFAARAVRYHRVAECKDQKHLSRVHKAGERLRVKNDPLLQLLLKFPLVQVLCRLRAQSSAGNHHTS